MLNSQVHNRINFNFEGENLIFDTSHLLFSHAQIDNGTKFLLNSLRKNEKINYKKILDLGCGYGILGIFLKKKFPKAEILCSDRDSLAIDFTEHNAKLNNTKVEALSSLDFENIKGKFDLIVCNFPAKLETEGLEYFISKSSQHLNKNGIFAFVVVKEFSNGLIDSLANFNLEKEKIKISFTEKKNDYEVYHLSFLEELKITKDAYQYNEISFELDGNIYPMITTRALQEFDTPHFTTQLIINSLEKIKYNSVTIINPGQGYSAITSAHKKSLEKISLVSRDLLQLEISSENLKLNFINKIEIINKDFSEEESDLLIWSIHEESDKEITEKLKIYKKNNEQILLAGRKTVISRVLKNLNIKPKKESEKGKYICIFV